MLYFCVLYVKPAGGPFWLKRVAGCQLDTFTAVLDGVLVLGRYKCSLPWCPCTWLRTIESLLKADSHVAIHGVTCLHYCFEKVRYWALCWTTLLQSTLWFFRNKFNVIIINEGIKLTESVVGFTQLLSVMGPWLSCLIGCVLFMCEFESTVLPSLPDIRKGIAFGGGRGGGS